MIENIKIQILALFLLVLTIFPSCQKDIGNYEYKEINDASISGINASYEVLRGQKLAIEPILTFTRDDTNDSTKYSYEWFSIDNTILPIAKTTIARTRTLNWTVTLQSINSNYSLFYVVTEKSTGVMWRKGFTLKVNTNISDGWLVLSEVNNEARLDFYNYISANQDFQYYQDIISTQSSLKLSGKPKLVYYYYRRDPFSSVIARSIFVGTENATYIINTQNNTFNNYVNMYSVINGYTPPPYFAQKVRSQATSYLAYLYDSSGQLFFENATQGSAFGNRVNKVSSGQTFNISPFFAEAYTNVTSYALMYDTDNKRFMEHKGTNTSSSVPTTASTLFNPGNIGMDLLYMDSSPALSGQTFALFKNSGGKLYLARIVCSSTTFNPIAFDEVTTAPELATATQYAIDPVEGYVMYLVGSKIYRYNPFDKTNKVVVDLGTRKVTLIKYQKMVYQRTAIRYAEYAKKLIICSYDEANPNTTGKMDLYNVPNLNGELTLYKSFDGFGKIADVTYRE